MRLIGITQAQHNSPLSIVTDMYGGDDKAQGSAQVTNGGYVVVPYSIVVPDGATSQQIADIEALIDGWGTLTLIGDPAAGVVTVSPAGNYVCHLWIDVGGGWEQQPVQDAFTPIDSVLDGLTSVGRYLVVAVDLSTMESGFVEMEVK